MFTISFERLHASQHVSRLDDQLDGSRGPLVGCRCAATADRAPAAPFLRARSAGPDPRTAGVPGRSTPPHGHWIVTICCRAHLTLVSVTTRWASQVPSRGGSMDLRWSLHVISMRWTAVPIEDAQTACHTANEMGPRRYPSGALIGCKPVSALHR